MTVRAPEVAIREKDYSAGMTRPIQEGGFNEIFNRRIIISHDKWLQGLCVRYCGVPAE